MESDEDYVSDTESIGDVVDGLVLTRMMMRVTTMIKAMMMTTPKTFTGIWTGSTVVQNLL